MCERMHEYDLRGKGRGVDDGSVSARKVFF